MEELGIPLMQIISYGGETRPLCFEALQNYRDGDKETGRKQYKDAEKSLYIARRAHSRAPKQSASGEFDQIDLLMVHAEDQMMVSEIIYRMTGELLHCMSETKG